MEQRGRLKGDELIGALAKKYNISFDEAKKAVYSQFHFVSDKMKDFHTIRLPYFGVFKPNLKRKAKIDEQRKRRLDKESENSD